jgi:hydrogenase nickel incorporation protein HypA/HybF
VHELSIAIEVICLTQEAMKKHRLTRVEEIGIRLGALSGINPDALSFGFDAAKTDTPLADSKLVIEQVPISGTCGLCKTSLQVDEFIFACPHCGSGDIAVLQGEELEMQYLVGE